MIVIPLFTWFAGFRIRKHSLFLFHNLHEGKLVSIFSELWTCLTYPPGTCVSTVEVAFFKQYFQIGMFLPIWMFFCLNGFIGLLQVW